MMWKWKRPAAFLLAAAMIFTMPGIPVFAMETDTSAVHKGVVRPYKRLYRWRVQQLPVALHPH